MPPSPFAPPCPPRFWFHLFLCSQTTSGQLCCVFCSMFILRHPPLLLLPASDVHPSDFACIPPHDTLGEGGAGAQQQAGYRVPHTREDGAPPRGCCSRVGGAHSRVQDHLPLFCGGGVASICPSLGLPLWFPICSYLNKKNRFFWKKNS